jgi:hypothetical protein
MHSGLTSSETLWTPEATLTTFQDIKWVEDVYFAVMIPQNRLLSFGSLFRDSLKLKFTNTIYVVGFSYLANGLIDKNRRGSGPTMSSSARISQNENFLKEALRDRILVPQNITLSREARSMRLFLHELCSRATSSNVSVVEGLWREAIAAEVLKECVCLSVSSTNSSDHFAASNSQAPENSVSIGTPFRRRKDKRRSGSITDIVTSGEDANELILESLVLAKERSDNLVDRLIAFLADARYKSQMQLSATKQCCMSADLAFATAFRRLSKSSSVELTKALVVRISSLIDVLKPHFLSSSWDQSIDALCDLLQVLFTQTSTEFQHFYELLLARRLLRFRFITLSTERRVLSLLPAMSRSGLMIRDLEQTSSSMARFRSHLLNRIDVMNLHVPEHITKLALSSESLNIHILTSSVWPSFWISPSLCASLKLPYQLDIIKKEFLKYFNILYGQDTEDEDLAKLHTDLNKKAFRVEGKFCVEFSIHDAIT